MAELASYRTTSSGYQYYIDESAGVVKITDYTGTAKKLTIPSKLSGYPVTAIDSYAFSSCSTLTSVTIPSSVTSIGGAAFSDCYSLTTVTIANETLLSNLGDFAFECMAPDSTITVPTQTIADLFNGAGAYIPDDTQLINLGLKDISKASVSSISAKTYTGSTIKPTVTVKVDGVKLTKDTDYTVTYSNNKNVGKARVTIKGKGQYAGGLVKTFKINPKGTTLSKVTAISKGFTAKWYKKTTQVTSYQIRYSTSSKMTNAKTKTLTKNTTVSKKATKLTGKKAYWVQVRTYKTVSGTKYYSAWSAAKKVVTLK